MDSFMYKQGLDGEEIEQFNSELNKEIITNMFVTPKDIDECIKDISRIIAESLGEFQEYKHKVNNKIIKGSNSKIINANVLRKQLMLMKKKTSLNGFRLFKILASFQKSHPSA